MKKKKMTTSKKMLIFLFTNCSLIELFVGFVEVASIRLAYSTGLSPDFTPLTTLIGAVVGEVVALAAYYAKATKENTIGGVTYLTAQNDLYGNGIPTETQETEGGE